MEEEVELLQQQLILLDRQEKERLRSKRMKEHLADANKRKGRLPLVPLVLVEVPALAPTLVERAVKEEQSQSSKSSETTSPRAVLTS